MLDGVLGDSKGCWSSSEEVALVKRLILFFVMICMSTSIRLQKQRGHLLNLSDQLRRKFSLLRPF